MDREMIDRRILWWLATLGYWVANKTVAEIETMFRYEAQQWGMTPEGLADMVREAYAELPVRQAA